MIVDVMGDLEVSDLGGAVTTSASVFTKVCHATPQRAQRFDY
jgi:hypothetical protein